MSAPDHAAARIAIVAHVEAALALHIAALAELGMQITLAQDDSELPTNSATWDAIVIELATVEASASAARLLGQQAPAIPTIIIADTADDTTIASAFAAGLYDWLPAGCPLPLLVAAIGRARARWMQRPNAVSTPETGNPPADLVHTINNQVAGLVGLIQLHIDDETLSPELRADLELMQQSAFSIAALLRDFDQR